MKTTKLNEKTKIVFKLFWMIFAVFTFAGCDILESDPDILEPKTELTGKEVYVLANGASFIDLNSKLQTNVPVRVAVTSETQQGELTDLGKGLLQYSPSVGNSTGRDGFEFTVYATNNEIIKRDSVVIIIENDSTNLPCNIYPVPDYVYSVRSPVLIDVTSNDVICADSVTVSVYKPANSFPPHHGIAEVQGNKIRYSPGSGFEGTDKIIYKLTETTDTSHVAYGIVYISADSSCSFRPRNDRYIFNEHEVDSIVTLPVFSNDSLCQPVNQVISIKSSPLYGEVSIVENGISYDVHPSATFPFSDYFFYEVCYEGFCKAARVDIEVKRDSVIACVLRARPDSINMVKADTLLQYIDVLQNDSICGVLKSLKITKAPLYGTSTVSNQMILYQRDPQQEKDDSLIYEICNNEGCSRATVLIKRKR